MSTTMSETEKALRAIFPDPESQARIDLCFSEARRTAAVDERLDRENLRRAAAGLPGSGVGDAAAYRG